MVAIQISKMTELSQLIETLGSNDPDARPKKLVNHARQIWPLHMVCKLMIALSCHPKFSL